MPDKQTSLLVDLRSQLDQTARLATQMQTASAQAETTFKTVLKLVGKERIESAIKDLPPCDVTVSEHYTPHRTGKPRKLDYDPELRAFVLGCIDRLSFAAIAAEVAQHFSPKRRIGKSALCDWNKSRKSNLANQNPFGIARGLP